MGNTNSKQSVPEVRYPYDDGAYTYEDLRSKETGPIRRVDPLQMADSAKKDAAAAVAAAAAAAAAAAPAATPAETDAEVRAAAAASAAAGAGAGVQEVAGSGGGNGGSISPVELLALLFRIIQMETMADLVYEIKWEGFDPMAFLTNLWNTKGKGNQEGFVTHIRVLIALGVTRGFGGAKTIASICARTSDVGAKKIEAAAKYFNVQKTTTTKYGVTIGRILTVFPREVFVLWQKNAEDKIGGHKDLPLEYKYPGSPAMMNQQAWDAYGKAYCLWMLDVSKNLWNQKDDTPEMTEKWARTSFYNNCSPLDGRKGIFDIPLA